MKKGELTTHQIVLLIILITSFVVVLFFLFRLDLGKETQAEICHNSIITRGNSALPADSVELDCKREYVCITKDGSCEGLTNPETFEVDSLNETYEVLADKMANCWWMFGEGKIDYIGDKAAKKNYCSICSQVLFDDSLFDLENVEEGKISKDELYDYLSEKEYSNEKTYAEYILGTNDIQELKQEILNSESNSENVGTFGDIKIGKQYYVLMGITSEIGNTYKWIGGATAVVGIITFPISAIPGVAGAILIGTGIGTGVAGGEVAGFFEPQIGAITVEGDGIPNNFMAPTIQEIDKEKFDALNCEEVVTYS